MIRQSQVEVHDDEFQTVNRPSPEGDNETVCLQNIGPGERRKRLRFGAVALTVGVLAAAGLILLQAHPGWRVALFLPFTSSAIGFLQAREKT